MTSRRVTPSKVNKQSDQSKSVGNSSNKENIMSVDATTPSRRITTPSSILSGPQRVLVPTKLSTNKVLTPKAKTYMNTTEAYRNGCYPLLSKDADALTTLHSLPSPPMTLSTSQYSSGSMNCSSMGSSTPQRAHTGPNAPNSSIKQSPSGNHTHSSTMKSPSRSSPGVPLKAAVISATKPALTFRSTGPKSSTIQASKSKTPGPLPGSLSDTINSDTSASNEKQQPSTRGHVPSFHPPPTPPPALSKRKSETITQSHVRALSSNSRNSAVTHSIKSSGKGVSKTSVILNSTNGSVIATQLHHSMPTLHQGLRHSCSFGSELSSVIYDGSIGGMELGFGEDELVTESVTFEDHSLSFSVSTHVSEGSTAPSHYPSSDRQGHGQTAHNTRALTFHNAKKGTGPIGDKINSLASKLARTSEHRSSQSKKQTLRATKIFTELDSVSQHSLFGPTLSESPHIYSTLKSQHLGNCSLSAVGLFNDASPRSMESWTSHSLQRTESNFSASSNMASVASLSAEVNQAMIIHLGRERIGESEDNINISPRQSSTDLSPRAANIGDSRCDFSAITSVNASLLDRGVLLDSVSGLQAGSAFQTFLGIGASRSPTNSESTDYINSSLSITQVCLSRDGRYVDVQSQEDSLGVMLDMVGAIENETELVTTDQYSVSALFNDREHDDEEEADPSQSVCSLELSHWRHNDADDSHIDIQRDAAKDPVAKVLTLTHGRSHLALPITALFEPVGI